MMKTLRKGQTMVEYIIIVVLIAVEERRRIDHRKQNQAAGGVIPCGVFAEGRRWSRRFSPS